MLGAGGPLVPSWGYPGREQSGTQTNPLAMSGDMGMLDAQIAQLMEREKLTEEAVKQLCEKVGQ